MMPTSSFHSVNVDFRQTYQHYVTYVSEEIQTPIQKSQAYNLEGLSNLDMQVKTQQVYTLLVQKIHKDRNLKYE